MSASEYGHVSICTLLFIHGADIDAVDDVCDIYTAYMYALLHRNGNMIPLARYNCV